jgi:nitrogen fixation/metabolism regulation signal transduction histidine kinase
MAPRALTPDVRIALVAAAGALVAALCVAGASRVALSSSAEPSVRALLTTHARALDEARQRQRTAAGHMAEEAARGALMPSFREASTEHVRSASEVDPAGVVLTSVRATERPPGCPPRVIEQPIPRSSSRLVVTFDDDCASLRTLTELRAFERDLVTSRARARRRAALFSIAGAALGVLIAAALGLWGAAGLSRRLKLLTMATERVGAGDLSVRVRPRGEDALDALMRAFNQMVEELALSRSRIDYLQRIAGWQEFARRLAHEIKNPLTPIQLAVQEVAKKYSGDDARFRKTLDTAREVVEEEVATLRRLVTAFSDFAKLPEVKTAAGDLAEFVRDAAASRAFLDEAAGEDPGRRAKVEFVAPDEPIPVMIDRMMLRRAFENLVRNAAQAIGTREGTIWVRAERHTVEVAAREGPKPESIDQAWLVVEDDGPGIAPEHRAKVFDPYFTTKSEGTGLGLAIVRKIAFDHDGDVGLEARPGGGARFVITLPLRAAGRAPRLSFVTFSGSSGRASTT